MAKIEIDVDNSLAALSFVVADQQRIICEKTKELNELKEADNVMANELDDWRNKCLRAENELCDERQRRVALEEKQKVFLPRVLNWQPFGKESPRIKHSYRQPNILVSVKVIKEGLKDFGNKPIPVGTKEVWVAPLRYEDGDYVIDSMGEYYQMLSWCEVTADNL